MQNIDLSGLKDIHPAFHDISVFPLAIGWWIIITFPVFLFFAVKLYRYLKTQTARFYAMRELDVILASDSSQQQKLIDISILFKRIAIKKFGNENIANLHGKEWADFIKSKANLDNKIIDVIASASYVKSNSIPAIKDDEIKNIVTKFIRLNT